MKLSVMTLGCPTWDLDTVCRNASAYGFDGVDFRGIQGELDVTRMPQFTTGAAATVRLLGNHNLVASGISTSIHVCALERRQQSLDEAKRTIEAALAIGAKNVRVFGEGRPDQTGYDAAAEAGAACMRDILELPDAKKLSWNFETHDHWVRSTDCRRLLHTVTDPAFGAAWDTGHTRRVAGESPADTLAALGDRVRYVHIKDAVRGEPTDPRTMKDGWRYVLPGQGELQLDLAVLALQRHGYDGWLMFEHEKRWHPELEEPEIAFPAFVAWAKAVLAQPV